MAVKLTDIPAAGADFEDYVAALFQAAGFYVEKNMVQREPSEVLELDFVATDYRKKQPRSILGEVKGGKWGYPDIFKVIGWMTYLGIDRGTMFVSNDGGRDQDQVNERVGDCGLSLVHIDDFTRAVEIFEATSFGGPVFGECLETWRYSYDVERRINDYVRSRAKSDKHMNAPAELLKYQRLVSDGVFFETSVMGRLGALYGAYQAHPKMTLACALEEEGKGFDPTTAATTSRVLTDALRKGEHPLVQCSMYIEQRARLAILKAAVDFCCQYPDEDAVKQDSMAWLNYAMLPQSFRTGVKWLRKQKHNRRYALLWQQFLFGYGGFFLTDRLDEEMEWFGEYAGIPAAEVLVALEAFDHFFPVDGWLVTAGNTAVHQVKMSPVYFKGIGAHHRRAQYNLKDYPALKAPGYTSNDLANWNNVVYAWLGGK